MTIAETRVGLALLLGALALGVVGCDDGESDDPAGAYSCTRIEAVLADARDCVEDDDCPCGSHCALGRCAHECLSSGDCEGGLVCNVFGQCSENELEQRPLATASLGALRIASQLVVLPDADAVRTISVTVDGDSSGPIRIAASDGIEVQCPDSGEFTKECIIDDADAGDTLPFQVRPEGEFPDEAEHHEVGIHTGSGRQSVGVTVGEPRSYTPESRPVGIYRGSVWPVGFGSLATTFVETLPGDVSDIRIPVTVTVFPGDGTNIIEIDDPFDILFTDDVARLVEDGSGGHTFEMPARLYLGEASPSVADVEVWSPQVEGDAMWQGETLTATFQTVFDGMTLPAHSPLIVWSLETSFSEELPGSAVAPSWPADYTPTNDPSTAADQLPVEGLVADALSGDFAAMPVDATAGDWAAATICTVNESDELDDELRFFASTTSPATMDLLCGVDPDTADAPTFLLETMIVGETDLTATLGSCRTDIGALGEASTVADVLLTEGCVDATRVVAALGHALTPDRSRALGTGTGADATATAIGYRLLQQWLTLHAFLGHETLRLQQLDDILVGDERYMALDLDVASIFGQAIGGWDLLFHPRTAVALAVAPPDVLLSPDYRAHVTGSTFPERQTEDHTLALPVSMLDALRSELVILSDLVDEAWSTRLPRNEIEPLIGEMLRRVFVVMPLAQALFENGRTVAVPEWTDEWDEARLGVASAVRELMRRTDRMRVGGNPLGIEEGDLPLYRVGDQSGALGRHSAMTDYLLGTADDGLAHYLVERAAEDLDAARDAWLENITQDRGHAAAVADMARREGAIRSEYGSIVTGLCGHPSLSTDTVLDLWDQIDVSSCFVDDACSYADIPAEEAVNMVELGYSLCFLERMRNRFGGISTGNDGTDAMIDEIGQLLGVGGAPFPVEITEASFVEGELIARLRNPASSQTWELPVESLSYIDPDFNLDRSGETGDQDYVTLIATHCGTSRDATEAARPATRPSSCTVTDECPADELCRSGSCEPEPTLDEDASCFYGSLGQQALAVLAATREVEIARSEMAEISESYAIATRSCELLEGYNSVMETHQDNLDAAIYAMGGVKLAADIVAVAAASTSNAARANWLKMPVGAGIATAAEVVKTIAVTTSLSLKYAMQTAERAHKNWKMDMGNELDELTCFNEAEMEMVGLRTAQLQIGAAFNDLAQANLEMKILEGEAKAALMEGHVALVRAESRRVPPLATDFWLNEHVESYRDHLRQARRVVYLALLAAEYEFQFTSGSRDDVLAARTPDELASVLDDLRAVTATGTVGGGSPSDMFTVVSLRDALLQMFDRTEMPPGWHSMNQSQRFRVLLASDVYASYDEDGSDLGQEIPFSLSPLGTLGLGDSQGIPLLSGTRCAERLWSVNASLLSHTPHIFEGSDTTFTNIQLRQRNTFYSQWCNPPGDEPLQVASTRPSRNLFLDPLSFEDSMGEGRMTVDSSASDDVNAYTTAEIQAYFNVERAELESEDYSAGDSQELAGRGLFGDYALFFPASILSIDGGNGLRLDNVNDVLLRFEYVSVAQ